MNNQMAYLIGMILGNGEIQRTNTSTTITIDIPYKKLNPCLSMRLCYAVFELRSYIVVLFTKSKR